ncbi:MAG TPA: DUF4159 domain-containing protein [Candidatus Paceibacterota bacterium]|nr:DUF4159 domain-containing protein [Candidatus Paceibacterota bacterium]
MNRITTLVLLTLSLLLFRPPLAEGQKNQIWVGPTNTDANPRWATQDDFDGSLVFCRGYYETVGKETGVNGWYSDYPGADFNFLVRLSEFTKTRTRRDNDGRPINVVVRLDSPLVFNCPVLYLSDVNTMELKENEISNLRQYFEKGGFVWVDDFWGSQGWNNWVYQIRKVLPYGYYYIFDIPTDHPLMNQAYRIEKIPQISHMEFWYAKNGQTSERGEDSKEVHFRGIEDEKGRLVAVMTHNTDIADTWEREGFDKKGEYFLKFSPTGYAIGINIFIYALSH